MTSNVPFPKTTKLHFAPLQVCRYFYYGYLKNKPGILPGLFCLLNNDFFRFLKVFAGHPNYINTFL